MALPGFQNVVDDAGGCAQQTSSSRERPERDDLSGTTPGDMRDTVEGAETMRWTSRLVKKALSSPGFVAGEETALGEQRDGDGWPA